MSEANAIDRPVRPPLEYKEADDLFFDSSMGVRKFVLHYHGRNPMPITSMTLGRGAVWVTAGSMLPVHIRPDGTSKDGPEIWLEAVPNA